MTFANCEAVSHLLDNVKWKEVAISLLERNVCDLCILRYLLIKEQSVYRDACTILTSLFDLPKRNNHFVCISCLEILQKKFSSEIFLQEIEKKVKNYQTDFTDFICALTIPISILIREHSLCIFLVENFSDFYSLSFLKQALIPLKDVWKWVNGPKLSEKLMTPFNQKSSFEIQIYFEYRKDDSEIDFLRKLNSEEFLFKRKSPAFNRINISSILARMSNSQFKKVCQVPMKTPSVGCYCEVIKSFHQAIYVAGRYNKFRHFSQTPWLIGGKKKHQFSVAEAICPDFCYLFQGKEYKFSASGREDVDVRMLGKGRPFVIEISKPKIIKVDSKKLYQTLVDLNKKWKGLLALRDVQLVSREEVIQLKEGEEQKTKNYQALCVVRGKKILPNQVNKINKMKNIILNQKTPIRVLHRRVLSDRLKTIFNINIQILDYIHSSNNLKDSNFEHYLDNEILSIFDKTKEHKDECFTLLKVCLSSQAGTYVKEFIHGDFGRTYPSLSSLLHRTCDILLLDVTQILLDWPKSLN